MEETSDAAGSGLAARAGRFAGPAAFALVLLLPLPDLAFDGKPVVATTSVHVVLGLTAWMAVWWMTEAVPLAVTSLLPLVVLPVSGVMRAKAVAPSYFDDTIALFLGGFCLALGLERSGLHRRVALRVLRIFGTRPRGMVLGFLVASALISMWVSNTATTLMLMPVAVTTIAAILAGPPGERTREERDFATACVLAVAFGASIGGVGTLIGTPPNMILKGVYDKHMAATGGEPLSFGTWFGIGAPIVVVLLPLTWLLLTRVTLRVPARFTVDPARPLPSRGLASDLAGGLAGGLGKWTFAEAAVLGVFTLTALSWVSHQRMEIGGVVVPLTGWDAAFRFGGEASYLSDATIACAAALLLFLLPSGSPQRDRILTWDYVQARIPWSALLLFGGGFSLAESFKAGGVDPYLHAAFAGLEGMPRVLLVGIVVAGVAATSEVASNTATAAMLLPVLASVAAAAGVDVRILLVAGTLGASCGYALPVATPPNTIAYSTGRVSAAQMARSGLPLDLVAIVVMTVATLVLGPLVFG